jgi:hypothetical protein
MLEAGLNTIALTVRHFEIRSRTSGWGRRVCYFGGLGSDFTGKSDTGITDLSVSKPQSDLGLFGQRIDGGNLCRWNGAGSCEAPIHVHRCKSGGQILVLAVALVTVPPRFSFSCNPGCRLRERTPKEELRSALGAEWSFGMRGFVAALAQTFALHLCCRSCRLEFWGDGWDKVARKKFAAT